MPTETFKSQSQAQRFVKSLITKGVDPSDISTQTLPGLYVVNYQTY